MRPHGDPTRTIPNLPSNPLPQRYWRFSVRGDTLMTYHPSLYARDCEGVHKGSTKSHNALSLAVVFRTTGGLLRPAGRPLGHSSEQQAKQSAMVGQMIPLHHMDPSIESAGPLSEDSPHSESG